MRQSGEPTQVYCTSSIEPIHFVHSARQEDFRVRELPLEELGAGEPAWTHLGFEVEKRGLSSDQALGRIARALGREPREIGYAGRKDSRGVTRQFLSIEHAQQAEVAALSIAGLTVLGTGRRARKLRVGELAGNRFDLLLRQFPKQRYADLQRALDQLVREGLPNYYGPQRFGAGGNTADLGRLLARGQWMKYLRAYVRTLAGGQPGQANSPSLDLLEILACSEAGPWRAARRLIPDLPPALVPLAKQMARRPGDVQSLLRSIPRRTQALHLSALQASVFNRVLTARMGQPGGVRRVLPGDLLLDPWTGDGKPAPEVIGASEVQQEADRLLRVPSGPLPGPAAERTRAEVALWEREALEHDGLDLEQLARLPGGVAPRGARRALVVGPRELDWEIQGDEVRLQFTLPPGSYATVLLAELHKDARPTRSQ